MRGPVIAAAILGVGWCFGQTTAARPAFEVASIKVSNAAPGSDSSNSKPGSLTMRNMTLRATIAMAYNVKESQVLGGPKWLDSDRYDVDAKAARAAEGPELMAMLQTLLAERWQVVFHREARMLPGYALVVTKAGLKMRPVEPGQSNLSTHNGSMTAQGASLAALAKTLSRRLGEPVADATGVAEVFDFKLELPAQQSRNAPAAAPGAEASDPASFAVAVSHVLEDELGLKLEARKVPVDVLAVDRAEKAAEN